MKKMFFMWSDFTQASLITAVFLSSYAHIAYDVSETIKAIFFHHFAQPDFVKVHSVVCGHLTKIA